MESLFEQEKVKSKALDQQISDFREELLKIKSQRNNLNSKLKNLEAESTNAREELKIVKVENETFKANLKEKEKVLSKKDNELKTSQTENKKLRELAAGVKQELEIIKVQTQQDNNNVEEKEYSDPVNLFCQFCDDAYESRVELKEHVRRNHQKDQVCQTQTIQPEVGPNAEEKLPAEILLHLIPVSTAES